MVDTIRHSHAAAERSARTLTNIFAVEVKEQALFTEDVNQFCGCRLLLSKRHVGGNGWIGCLSNGKQTMLSLASETKPLDHSGGSHYTPTVDLCAHRINKKRRVCPRRRSEGTSGKGECDMKLNELADNPGAAKKQKRVARGPGSGKGKTAGRGIKGQKSRSGVAIGGYEGGQMPLYRRLPKRGFTKPNQKHYAVVNLGLIEKFIAAGKLDAAGDITEDMLVAAGLTSSKLDGIRVLSKGEIKTKVSLHVTGASASAVAAVAAAGGAITITALPAIE